MTTEEQHSLPRRLRRRSDERVLGGVASGLGEYFNVDPLLIRILLVASIVFGGLGILLYAAAWLLVPDETSDRSIVEKLFGGGLAAGLLGGLLVLIGAAVLIRMFGVLSAGSDGVSALVVALFVIAVGAVLVRRRETDPQPSAPMEAAATEPVMAARVRPVPRPASPLGWYAVGAALVGIGLLALADGVPSVTVAPVHYVGVALGAIGAGLVIGAWWGHARWLIVPGLLLLPLAWAASLIDVPFEGGWTSEVVRPATSDEIRDEYRLTGGQLILDLTRLDDSGEPIAITASVAVGDLLVLLPDDASADIETSVGGGKLSVLGAALNGMQLHETQEITGGGPSFQLDLAAGIGEVRVETRQTEDR